MLPRSSSWRGTGLASSVRTEWTVESRAATIELTAQEQRDLESAGRRLAKGTNRFGVDQPDSTATAVRVRRIDDVSAQVRVSDAVGLIATPTLQLHVAPKIPTPHLRHLLHAAELAPRLDSAPGYLAADDDLAALVAHWFITALERLLEQGLAADYRRASGEIKAVRGRITPLDTARLYYRGRLAVAAEYEEHDQDTPLNRVLRHAARTIAAATPLPPLLRRRALRAVARMERVGELQPADLRHPPLDRRTGYYREAIRLAHEIINATGRTLHPGPRRAWTFLVRTPALIEDGIRQALADGLAPRSVRNRSIPLPGTASMHVNPDLVIGDDDYHVGDIKYKTGGDDWNRSDLYEVVAFAAALRASHAAIVDFRPSADQALSEVRFGDHAVREIVWPTDVDPEKAEALLLAQTESWITGSPAPGDPKHD